MYLFYLVGLVFSSNSYRILECKDERQAEEVGKGKRKGRERTLTAQRSAGRRGSATCGGGSRSVFEEKGKKYQRQCATSRSMERASEYV
jgi:hypothetical protein